MFTIDASVWVNADSPSEPGHAASRSLLDALARARTPVVVPTLLPVEFAGVISRTRGQPELARAMAEAMLGLDFVRWIALDAQTARGALELAAARRLRGADAVYAAVAAAHGCVLVTLDQEQLTRLPPAVRTMTPEDALAMLGSVRPAP